MHLRKIPLSETHAFSEFFLDYVQQKKQLNPFFNLPPKLESFQQQIVEKQKYFSDAQREVLVNTLQQQYANLQPTDPVKKHLNLLKKDSTFTITTGHQLNLLTGPLYVIYKLVTVINTCKALKATYPNYDFVPVYWMATEDHDYDEIKSFRLYQKKYTWNTSQGGAVGRFTTAGIKEILSELPGDLSPFEKAYQEQKNLSDAVRHYIHLLFQEEGLLVLDADHANLKASFTKVIREDLTYHTTKAFVDKTNEDLNTLGYTPQVHCRDINFFFLEENHRNRLEKSSDGYQVVDRDLSFSEEEMEALLQVSPEKFSPNVIMRPLYQETILPNLAYIGGPSEIIYWLQLKAVFDHHSVPFPILMPRNFAIIMDAPQHRKFKKTNLDYTDLFKTTDELLTYWVKKNSVHSLSTEIESKNIITWFDRLKTRAAKIDSSLGPFLEAETKRMNRSLEKIEKKMIRSEKRIQREKLGQIESLKNILFPGGNLQERTDNILNFYQSDRHFIKKLLALFDPFDYQFNIVEYTEGTS